jgi:transcriptional regulator of acetoin/glycerol metabolism
VRADDERSAILAALEQAGGNRARVSEMLGMGRTTLWRKMKQYGIVGEAEADRERAGEEGPEPRA